jgi:hypothetical protein
MWENLLVALSNLPAIFPIYTAWSHHDYATTSTITYVAVASFVSHLAENHKHGMPGIGLSPYMSYLLNRLDVIGCGLVAYRLGSLYYRRYGLTFHPQLLWYTLPVIFLRISEYDKYNPHLKTRYMITHSLWHVSIFWTLDRLLHRYLL